MLVVATQTTVRSPLHLFPFLVLAGAAWLAAALAPGNRKARVRPTSLLRWYTLTVWEDEAVVERYARARTHAAAVKDTGWLTTSGRFARFEVEAPGGATWARAFSAIEAAPTRRSGSAPTGEGDHGCQGAW